jgi:hypothetical protein
MAMQSVRAMLMLLAMLMSSSGQASFHTFALNEFYSNADGSIQFIELREGFGVSGQQFLNGHMLTSTQGSTTHTFPFPSNLPSNNTANQSVLIATPGFAALGIVTPDYIVPAGFLFPGGGTVDYAGVDSVTYAALPVDGVTSISRSGATGVNSPQNFAGQTGSIPAAPPPSPPSVPAIGIPLLDVRTIAALFALLVLTGVWSTRRRTKA